MFHLLNCPVQILPSSFTCLLFIEQLRLLLRAAPGPACGNTNCSMLILQIIAFSQPPSWQEEKCPGEFVQHSYTRAILTLQGDGGVKEFHPESSLKALRHLKKNYLTHKQKYRVKNENTPSTQQVQVVTPQEHTVINKT